jgi:RecA/RadA recombinase
MDSAHPRSAALAALRERWGDAAPRPATEVFGALAVAPAIRSPHPALAVAPAPLLLPAGTPLGGTAPDAAGRVVSTGFAELDAILGPGGLPRPESVALAGWGSAGTTTLALRTVASAQAAGAIAAWVDGSHSLDAVEAVARGVQLEWLVVLVPTDPVEGLEMAGALLQARAVDVLVLDTGNGRAPAGNGRAPAGREARSSPIGRGPRRPSAADRLDRLLALARRAGSLLVVLEPADLPDSLHGVLDGAGLRLELRHRDWIRLGREVVGQRAEVRVARDHHGPPGRRTELRILYAEGGARDRCLRLPHLLDEASRDAPAAPRLAPLARPPGVLARPRAPG